MYCLFFEINANGICCEDGAGSFTCIVMTGLYSVVNLVTVLELLLAEAVHVSNAIFIQFFL